MTTFTVTLPDTFIVHSRGVDYKFRTETLPAAMVAVGAIHGFKQKLADSLADKTKVAGKEEETIYAVWDAINAGDWTRRREAGPGMSELDTEIFRMALAKVTAAVMSKLGLKKVKELTEDQTTRIAEVAAEHATNNRVEFAAIAQQTIDARRAAKAVIGATEVDLGDF